MQRQTRAGYFGHLLLFFCLIFIFIGMMKFTEANVNKMTHFRKVMIVVLENADYDDALKQPFLFTLARKGALLNNFYGETHPSQPNYIALISGSTQGVSTDSNVNLSARHLGDLLEYQGLTWKAYVEQYPGNCFQGSKSGGYVRKHLPFISFKNVQNNPRRCARLVNASQLTTDLVNHALPDVSLYIPDLNNDGHDTDIGYADRWLAKTFGPILHDPNFLKDMLFVVTTDESEWFGGNHILTILYGLGVKAGSVTNTAYNHYSILRTIEDEFELGTLGLNDATATPINGIWQ